MLSLPRVWFAFTGAVALIGVVWEMWMAAGSRDGVFPTAGGRVFNVLCFFTIESNIVAGVVCLVLAIGGHTATSGPTWLRVFRLVGLICITVTGLVYNLILAGEQQPTGARAVTNVVLHMVVPACYVVGWLAFGPRGWITARIAGLAIIPPTLWLVFTFLRGPVVQWYPYPFMNVIDIGYARSLANTGMVLVLFLALLAGAFVVDVNLGRREQRRPV